MTKPRCPSAWPRLSSSAVRRVETHCQSDPGPLSARRRACGRGVRRCLALSDRACGEPAREHATAEEGALQRALAVHPAAAEACGLADRVQAVDGAAIGA